MFRKKWFWILFVLVALLATSWLVFANNEPEEEETDLSVEVVRGDIVDKALAVGTIEPRVETDVKSQLSGVVKREYAQAGDFVRAGAVLLEIKPNPTPRELVDAERRIELRELELKNLKGELDRQQHLFEKKLISAQEFERSKRSFDEAELNVRMSREQLSLLKDGKINGAKGVIETVVRAPVSGYVLEKTIEVGDPVVPLTSYQEGTVLMTMANMNDLIFRGTVDEIDVGRLEAAMPVKVKVGALPGADVTGVLSRIWLKAKKEENSTVFPVEIEITGAKKANMSNPEGDSLDVVLRAGYSANAEIIIEQRTDVLLVPERLIEYAGDSTRVTFKVSDEETEVRDIKTGLSDAINTEVLEGVAEGDKLMEKPRKVIE